VTRHVRRFAILAALAGSAFWLTATPASAGGSWLNPVQDRYEPGDTASFVGYVSTIGSLGTVDDGPFFGYLRRFAERPSAPGAWSMAPFTPAATDLPIGELLVVPAGGGGLGMYRVSVEFEIPNDLPAGHYGLNYCNASCTKGLTDLVGGQVFIGIEPRYPLSRSWPLDELAIADAPDNALLTGPYGWTTAGDVRAGVPPTPVGGPPPPSGREARISIDATSAEQVADRSHRRTRDRHCLRRPSCWW
jgi:hypothetical protein